MKALRSLFGNWWVVTGLAAVLAAILLCLVLPLAWGTVRPLTMRLILLAVVVIGWGGFAAWRLVSAGRASRRIARSLEEAERGSGEEQVLGRRMAEALGQLRSVSGNGRDYLYSRPWYVIIGPPGGGKTTALLKSGMRFPYSDTAMKGIGGTRNLDFWFADEAVMIDTAGRYTSQDSGDDRDSQGWRTVLDLLRKNRPLQPINGVLVAIPLDELAGGDVHALDRHAATIRRRIAELQTGLEVEVPVYVVFTKADLIAGFSEFYDDLDVDGRRAVLGSTFPWARERGLGPVDLAEGFDALAQAIADRASKRLQEVQDPRRRAMIVGFPSQIYALRSRVVRLLEGAFPSAANTQAGRLRGFYLTSGVQEGTPLDRILSGTAALYDEPQRPPPGAGRAYFINRLLTEVVFEEAGLVQTSPALTRRRNAMMLASTAVIGLISTLVLATWMTSYMANRDFQRRLTLEARSILAEARTAGVNVERYSPMADADLETAEPILTRLRALPRGYEQSRKGPPLHMTFGLYQRGLSRKAQETYLGGLQRILLPRLMVRLEDSLGDTSDNMATYERLKSYLLLGGRGPKADAKSIKAWAVKDWNDYALKGGDRSSVRDRYGRHLDAMLGDKRFGRIWGATRQAPLDAERVLASQRALQSMPLADRAYAILVQDAVGKGADWRVSDHMDRGGLLAFSDPEAVGAYSVPWFYTREGYQQAYQVWLQTLPQKLNDELWVLGGDSAKDSMKAQMANLKAGVAQHYAAEYERSWDGLVALMRPGDYFGDPQALNAVNRTPSPLVGLMRQLRIQTRFSDSLAAKAAKAGGNRLLGSRPQFLRDGLDARTSTDAGVQIEIHFADIHDYVGDGKSESRADQLFKNLRAFVEARMSARDAAQSGGYGMEQLGARVTDARAALTSSAGDAPAQLKPFTDSLVTDTGKVQVSAAREVLNGEYKKVVLADCVAATTNAFPFVLGSTSDASLGVMRQTFGEQGAFGGFIRQRIIGQQLVRTDGPMWRWRDDNPLAAGLQPSSAEQFQKAARIGDLLANGMQMTVQVQALGGAVTAVNFSEGGRPHTLVPGAEPVDVVWNANAGYPAQLSLMGGTSEVARFRGAGPWGLFRLFAAADLKGDEPPAFTAVFRKGTATATLLVKVQGETNPFGRGFWALRCPDQV